MGQDEIVQWLEKHKDEWFTAHELADNLNLSKSAIDTSLFTLYSYRFSNLKRRKRMDEKYQPFEYSLKRY